MFISKKCLLLLNLIFATLLILPSSSYGCACGCGLFDVGTNAMFPTGAGGMVFFEYNFLDQNQNRNRSTSASADDNGDKEIRTHFFKVGGQYMFNRNWGAQVEVPYWSRHFSTTDDSGNSAIFDHAALGDIRLKGIYAGLFDDMSTGITFGLKLPTGDASYPSFDADTEIGTGSTDLLLGIYHLGKITQNNLWNWFVQVNLDEPILSKPGYLPGNEVNTVVGAYYNGWTFGEANKVAPILELLASARGSDNGVLANEDASGYRRLLVSPGVELDLGRFRIYADIQAPLYQYYNGDQLSAPVGYKFGTLYSF